MSSETRAVFRHSRVYAIGSLLSLASGLAVVSVLTHRLPPSDYGTLGVLMVTSEIIGAVAGLRLGTAMSRLYFDHTDEAERAKVVSTALLIVLATAAATVVLVTPVAEPLARLLLGTPGRGGLMMLAVCAMLLNTLLTVALQYLQVRQRSWLFLAATAARVVAHVSLTVLFTAVLGWGLTGALWALLATNAAMCVLVVGPVLARVGLHFSRPGLVRMARFALPMLPAQLVEITMMFADRLLVTKLASLAAAGELFLAMRFSSLLNGMLIVPFGRTYLVRRFQAHGSGARDVHASRVFTYFFLVMTAAGLALSLLGPEVVAIVAGERYRMAAAVIPFAVLTQILLSLLLIVELGIYYAKRSVYFTYINAVMLVAHVAFALVLVPRFGAPGAAGAGCASTSVRLGLTVLLARRLKGPVPEWGRLAVVLAAAVAAWAAAWALSPGPYVEGLVWRAVVAFAFPVAMFLSPFFSRQERFRLVIAVLRIARPRLRGVGRRRAAAAATAGLARPRLGEVRRDDAAPGCDPPSTAA